MTSAPAASHPVMGEASMPGEPAATEAAAPRTILVLGEDEAATRHAVTRWSLVHPDADRDRIVVLHLDKTPANLPPGVETIVVPGGVFDLARRGARAKRLLDALTGEPEAQQALARAQVVVVPDAVEGAARGIGGGRTVHPWSRFVTDVRIDHLSRLLESVPHAQSTGPGIAALIAEALDCVEPHDADTSARIARVCAHAISSMLRSAEYPSVASVADQVHTLPQATRDGLGLDAMLRAAEISLGAPGDPGPDAAAATACFTAAEARTRTGDVADVPMLISAGMRLLFNRELHTDGEHAVLIDDPQGHLRPWRDSAFAARIHAALTARRTPTPGPEPAPERPAPDRPRVVVLAGAYGSFYQPIVDLLRGGGIQPTVVRVEQIGERFRRQNLDEPMVSAWLRLIDPDTFGEVPVDERMTRQLDRLRAHLQDADVVFADWCDPGAAYASLLLAPTARLVVRLHRLDVVRVWHQVIDWGAVDAAILVAEHVRRMLLPQIADPSGNPPAQLVVLNNVIDVQRYRRPKAPGAHRRLALVGWARQVKDPLFALDVLQELLATDPGWELHLIGRDFAAGGSPAVRAYADRFRERVLTPELARAVRFVGFTDRLEEALDHCGWALSTSRVEGWPVGVVEAAASGCIPVIRDWPQVAAIGGAREIYRDHPEWVIDTPAQAAARILAHAAADEWEAESARVQRAAAELSSVGATRDDYLELILGRKPVLPQAD